MLQNIIVDLDSREDQYHQTYYMSRFRAPVKLSFKAGVAFCIYTSDKGFEEMRISCAKDGSECSSIRKRFKPNSNEVNRYVVPLEKRIDSDGNQFYIGIVQDQDLELDLSKDGIVFFIYTSKEGREELQIGKNEFRAETSNDKSHNTEVIHRGSEAWQSEDTYDDNNRYARKAMHFG